LERRRGRMPRNLYSREEDWNQPMRRSGEKVVFLRQVWEGWDPS